jgi:hypothetical protein
MTRLTLEDLARACGLTVRHGPDGRPRFTGPPQAEALVGMLNAMVTAARRQGPSAGRADGGHGAATTGKPLLSSNGRGRVWI